MSAIVLLPERDCQKCTAALQAEYGCNAFKLPDGRWQGAALNPIRLGEEDVFRCPRRPVKDDPEYFSELFQLYRGFKNGVMPDEGGAMAQSARGWRLLNLIDAYISQAEAVKYERMRQQKGSN